MVHGVYFEVKFSSRSCKKHRLIIGLQAFIPWLVINKSNTAQKRLTLFETGHAYFSRFQVQSHLIFMISTYGSFWYRSWLEHPWLSWFC